MYSPGLVHILDRHYGRVTVCVINAAGIGRASVRGDLVGVFLAIVQGQVAEALKYRHFQTAGDDDSGLRDMCNRGQVGIEGMRLLPVPG